MLSKPSNSKSLAFKAVFRRLPGSCNAGGVAFILFCHVLVPIGDEHAVEGDMGGVEVVGISIEEDEPRVSGLEVAMSIELSAADFGEGIAEPVEAYKGRNSSGL